ATADVIVLADQDDEWEPDRLATICDAFAADSTLNALVSDASLVDDAGARLPGTLWESIGLRAGARRRVDRGLVLEQLCRWNGVTRPTPRFRAGLGGAARAVPA